MLMFKKYIIFIFILSKYVLGIEYVCTGKIKDNPNSNKIVFSKDSHKGCYTFSEYNGINCCCLGAEDYKSFCTDLEDTDENNKNANKCSENIIQKFITDFSNSKNLCDFCKNGVKWLKLNANICAAFSSDKSDLSLPKSTSDFLNDFVRSGGSCDTVCDCIEPKPMSCSKFGKCCEGCVCAENIVGDGIDGYTATLKEGCTWPQFWDDWSKQTTTKCTTKTFN